MPFFIPKRRLLSVNGLKEGSKAKFICDDYHFTHITHDVCRADGSWEALDNPCVRMKMQKFSKKARKSVWKKQLKVESHDGDVTISSLVVFRLQTRSFDIMAGVRCEVLMILLQIYESVTTSREQIEEQLSNIFTSKCLFKTTEIGYFAEYGACKIPTVFPKGKLLSVDGLKEGSKAKFICDDYHFTNISHGVCRADGTWEGLEHPCVLVSWPPYRLQTLGRIIPGRCVIILATPKSGLDMFGVELITQDWKTIIFHSSFRYNVKLVVSNTRSETVWGREEKSHNFPFHYDQESNMTLCVEEDVYRWYADGKELLTFKHRLPVTLVEVLNIRVSIVRSVTFTEGKE